ARPGGVRALRRGDAGGLRRGPGVSPAAAPAVGRPEMLPDRPTRAQPSRPAARVRRRYTITPPRSRSAAAAISVPDIAAPVEGRPGAASSASAPDPSAADVPGGESAVPSGSLEDSPSGSAEVSP